MDQSAHVPSDLVEFPDAWATITGNKFRTYPNIRNNGESGVERLRQGSMPNIWHEPKFKLSRSDRFFTIGSCFARNVERALDANSVDVLTKDCRIPGEFYSEAGPGNRNSALNAYNPHSMRDIIRITRSSEYGRKAVLPADNQGERFIDMLMSGLRPLSTDELAQVRDELKRTYARLETADVVIMTLGYTESWFDSVDRVFTNRSPASARQTVRHGSRFFFYNADADHVERALNEIVELIGSITENRAKIILTVSPVPLSGTYTNQDVICANSYSKATLLTAARKVANSTPNVDYYPSYELVTLGDQSQTWKADGAHVRPEVVERVIGKFVDDYL